MTTTLAAPESKPDQDPLRVLTITANLLPSEVTDARRATALKRTIAVLLIVLVAALVAWDVQARRQSSSAQSALNSAQAQKLAFTHQQGNYGNLLATKNAAQAITTELQTLMSQDLQWWKLLPAVRATAPAGVNLINVDATIASTSAGDANALPAALPGITSASTIGAITLVGTAPDKVRIANFVQALNNVAGLANPYLLSATAQSGGSFQFTISVEITSAALGGRYSATSSTSTGGN